MEKDYNKLKELLTSSFTINGEYTKYLIPLTFSQDNSFYFANYGSSKKIKDYKINLNYGRLKNKKLSVFFKIKNKLRILIKQKGVNPNILYFYQKTN